MLVKVKVKELHDLRPLPLLTNLYSYLFPTHSPNPKTHRHTPNLTPTYTSTSQNLYMYSDMWIFLTALSNDYIFISNLWVKILFELENAIYHVAHYIYIFQI